MGNTTKVVCDLVYKTLNDPKYRNYWFPGLRQILPTNHRAVFRLISTDGSTSTLQIAAGYRKPETLHLHWSNKVILVSELESLIEDPEALCEKIHATFRAYKKYWETKDKEISHRAAKKPLQDAIEMKQILRIQRRSHIQGPSWFEKEFFGTTAHNIYINWHPEDILEHRHSQKIMRADVQQSVYGWNPAQPSTRSAQSLFRYIQDNLPEELAPRLRFYCLLASRADRSGGTDLIIGLEGRKKAVVKVDLTSDPHKKDDEDDPVWILHSHYYGSPKLQEFAMKVAARLQNLA